VKHKNKIGIDLFSGAGGLTLGALSSGINVKYAIESNLDCIKTYKNNFPKVEIIASDIRKVHPKDFIKEKPFIVFGGPPCQGFSVANKRTRNTENGNNFLFLEFIKFIDDLKPDWFLFENVEGFKSFNNGKLLEEIVNVFMNIGYKTESKVLCASDYFVPQKRNRFIMVGNKYNYKFKFPITTSKNSEITVKEAISDLPILNNGAQLYSLEYKSKILNRYTKLMRKKSKYSLQNFVTRNQDFVIERYSYIKPGENWKNIPKNLMKNYKNINNCHSGIYKRLNPEEPSIVISNYRKNMLIHPYENRGLSVREAARLQSFYDNFLFEGTLSSIQQQIGNAVPPLLAKVVFEQIIKYQV
jgi:DNA (cytosine-5)-methyltransferase 1